MLMPEEKRVLSYLRTHFTASVAEVGRVCLTGAASAWVDRILANLDWLGYVTLYPGQDSESTTLQITAKGLASAGGRVLPASAARPVPPRAGAAVAVRAVQRGPVERTTHHGRGPA